MDELTKRNFHAMSDGLKSVRNELMEVKEDNKRKDSIISELNVRVDMMQQQISTLFAKSMGNGITG